MNWIPLLLSVPLLLLAIGCRETPLDPAPSTEERRAEEPPLPLLRGGPEAAWRTGRIDDHVRRVPSRIQAGVFKDPNKFLRPLVEYLVEGAEDPFHRVKRIHDWIADNIAYNTEAYFSGKLAGTAGIEAVLQSGSSVCEGYSTLFGAMTEIAGVRSEKISGYGRGFAYDPRRVEDPTDSNHAWNAVEIEGRWYLLDSTWDAGHVSGRSFEKAYSTRFLFLPPEQFVHTHFPTDPRWQLLDPPLTSEQFRELPYLRGEFFELGLALLDDLGRKNVVDDQAEIRVAIPEAAALTTALMDEQGGRQENRTFLQRRGERGTVHVRFPAPGRWTVKLYVKIAGAEGPYMGAGELVFIARGSSREVFPEVFGDYHTLRAALVAPLAGPLAPNRTISVRIRVPDVDAVAVITGEKEWTHLQRGAEDHFEGQVRIPGDGHGRIVARRRAGDQNWTGLVSY